MAIPQRPDPITRVYLRLEIDYKSGNHMGKDFSTVQDLAQYLKENPDMATMVNYVPKSKGK